jgi:inosose dehydratase
VTSKPLEQHFDFGCQLITWDIWGRPLPDAYEFLAATGFRWVEALAGNSLGTDAARRYMPLPGVGVPPAMSDTDILARLALLQRVEDFKPLRLSGLFVNATYVDDSLWPSERDAFEAIARFVKGCDAPLLVCGGGPNERHLPHSSEAYQLFAKRLAEVADRAGALGLRTVFHPHLDFFIETREQLDRLMDVLDTSRVGLCIDPAHLAMVGSDPVDALETYIDHVHHVHLKDCVEDVFAHAGWDRYLAFRPLGAGGGVDVRGFVDVLLRTQYRGLAIIELDVSEQPEDDCRTSVRYITETLALALQSGSGQEPLTTSVRDEGA